MNNYEFDRIIFQLKDLRDEKIKYIDWDDHDDIFLKDVLALSDAIYYLNLYYNMMENKNDNK